ncbi:penicillin-binding transpeptidase domain-containing protein [Desulfonatronovibrio hydrogenovorans]|uniref:penicillin-binding transpeptidase domain-containing protein n=1 Tax=Desulfonatronovibrio hydrogenovorans TaxID=53245 RepID=UPI00054D6F8E|nr:penicillin-binding transpeptidase domain-containing protein [Desulfonatronovibrio hydrogenovorans]
MVKRVVNNKPKDRSRLKIVLVFCLVVLAWTGLWSRAFFVQVIQGDELAGMADRQYFSREKITGKRGEIFDRNGNVLAQSVRSKSIYANPFLVQDPDKAAISLAGALGGEAAQIRAMLDRQAGFVWIRRKVSDRQAFDVAGQNIPGVFIIDEHSRVYPRGHMLGQVLGFVGMDNQGLEGLERSLNDRLTGAEMVIVTQKDASGHAISLLAQDPTAKIDGQDVVLTIDSEIQFTAEKALSEAVERFGGRYGISLVVHVPTGDILAWAGYPFFNPNNFQRSNAGIWRNRAAVDLIEPGSTLKPFLVAAAMEEGVAKSDSLYFCENGRWRIGRNEIRDVREHGWLTVNRVLRYSSNICSAKIGLDLGPGPYFNYLQELGFNSGTNLPLPGQGRGILRPYPSWSRMDLATISFGQGMAATPLQLARAYLVLANEGRFTELNLIMEDRVQEPDRPRVFSREVSRQVLSMLRDSVEMGGTGTRARVSGVEAGGKTGTAQKASAKGGYGDKYVASFVGFIPALEPEYMIMVVIDEPSPTHYGGVVAAPVFSEIGTGIISSDQGLRLRNLPPGREVADQEVRTRENSRFSVSQRRDLMGSDGEVPDLRGVSLREAVENLLSAGVVPVLEGAGVRVEDQSPLPGEPWDQMDRKMVLRLCES